MTDNVIEILNGIKETNEQILFAQMYNGDSYLNEQGQTNAEIIYGDGAKEFTVSD